MLTATHPYLAVPPQADEVVRKHNLEARANGEPLHYVYRHLYRPTQGMFCCPPEDLELGSYHEVRALLPVTRRENPSRIRRMSQTDHPPCVPTGSKVL